MIAPFAWSRPGSLQEAIRLAREDGARVHAGGTDLLGCLRDEIFGASRVVSLSALEALRGIREPGRSGRTEAPGGEATPLDATPLDPKNGLRIGALTTITDIAESPVLREHYAALAQAASEVASPQLRHQGTLGGNLCQKPRCWYYRGEFHCLRKGGSACFAVDGENEFHCILGGDGCFIVHPSDTAPALIALDASTEIEGPRGRRTVPVADLHVPPSEDITRETLLEPGEIITHIILPPPPAGLRSAYRKVRARRSWDFALSGVALALSMDGDVVRDARVVLSGVAPVPWRSTAAEEVLRGRRLDADAAASAGRAAVADAAPLEKNAYKVDLASAVVRESLLALAV